MTALAPFVYSRLLEDIRREFPAFKVVPKVGGFWRAIARVMPAAKHFTTTLGNSIYVPSDWASRSEEEHYIILRHERVHMRQQKRLGLGWMPLGLAVFMLLYALLPLPIGLAWFRYRFERTAYVESLRVHHELHDASEVRHQLLVYADFLSGPGYGWSWPRHVIISYFTAAIRNFVRR
ncbi:MAG: hypothetical protein A2Y38_13955 [Spirochaetes bacterium GWB1_59_5]|nr:MAG: hypothetical protein A2Y38_13955 [Spirochaetes bacterium GWB1_59_5]